MFTSLSIAIILSTLVVIITIVRFVPIGLSSSIIVHRSTAISSVASDFALLPCYASLALIGGVLEDLRVNFIVYVSCVTAVKELPKLFHVCLDFFKLLSVLALMSFRLLREDLLCPLLLCRHVKGLA